MRPQSMDEEEQELPFTPFSSDGRRSHHPPPDQENPSSKLFPPPLPPREQLHRRGLILCCGCCSAIVLIVAVIIIVLALTVFKVKEPNITISSVSIHWISLPPATSPLPALATLIADLTLGISLKNSNAASFRFAESKTVASYREREVGRSVIPAGMVHARRIMRANIAMVVHLNVSTSDDSVFKDGVVRNLTMKSNTEMEGRVNYLGMFKKHVVIMMNCTYTLSNQTIFTQICTRKVHL